MALKDRAIVPKYAADAAREASKCCDFAIRPYAAFDARGKALLLSAMHRVY